LVANNDNKVKRVFSSVWKSITWCYHPGELFR
jgi:hypothetical protein